MKFGSLCGRPISTIVGSDSLSYCQQYRLPQRVMSLYEITCNAHVLVFVQMWHLPFSYCAPVYATHKCHNNRWFGS